MDREFSLSDHEFADLQRLVRNHTGIDLNDSKRELVYSRLSRRLRSLGMSSFGDYCRLLHSGVGDEVEQFANVITTNLTSFFRERHHFDFLSRQWLPALKAGDQRRVRIWSAGCATGEEPYSIAMALSEARLDLSTWDIKILATDLDSASLAQAREGRYDAPRVERLSPRQLAMWFDENAEYGARCYRIKRELQELVRFAHLNLMDKWPMRAPFDLIFCRNVVIYFDQATRRSLFDRFASMQRPGAHLIVGHSENLHRLSDGYRLLGKTIYRRVAP